MKQDPNSRDWLMLNAVEAWLYYFPEHEWTDKYKELRDELREIPEARKRGRPAKKARTKTTTSNPPSKEAD